MASRKDTQQPFSPLTWTMKEIRDAIPPRLFVRSTMRSCLYLVRDLLMAATAWSLACYIDPTGQKFRATTQVPPVIVEVGCWAAWCTYWWFQGLIFTGIWVIGHECGHGAFSSLKHLNNVIGFLTHTALWTPYFSWRISHHRHHATHGSMEKDEVYVPKTRSDLGIPDAPDYEIDWDEIFGDTPIYTLAMLIRQQLLAFPAYLLFNVSGQKMYPKWTNHFDPNSILFTPDERNAVIFSNIGMAAMVWLVSSASSKFGFAEVVKYYGIPWLFVTHWFVMITYLHHTDPLLPHYRGKSWTFQRGAAATMDRDILGWQGRFFLHDVAHFHVIHHFFPMLPFYNAPEATQHLKRLLGDQYMFSDKPAFKALWENYNRCQFVEDKGEILFYRDRKGKAARYPVEGVDAQTKSE